MQIAQGPGGQHVNKAATAVLLRFDIRASGLPEFYKERLLTLSDRRISSDGVVVIRAQAHRSQQRNRQEALERLRELVVSVTEVRKARIATRPGKGAKRRRLDAKSRRSRTKAMRSRPGLD